MAETALGLGQGALKRLESLYSSRSTKPALNYHLTTLSLLSSQRKFSEALSIGGRIKDLLESSPSLVDMVGMLREFVEGFNLIRCSLQGKLAADVFYNVAMEGIEASQPEIAMQWARFDII
jgi:hypothetical protein